MCWWIPWPRDRWHCSWQKSKRTELGKSGSYFLEEGWRAHIYIGKGNPYTTSFDTTLTQQISACQQVVFVFHLRQPRKKLRKVHFFFWAQGSTLLAPDRKGTTGLFGKHGQKRPQGLYDGEGQHSSDALDSRVTLASIQIPQPLLASYTTLGSFTIFPLLSLIFLFCKMDIASPRLLWGFKKTIYKVSGM